MFEKFTPLKEVPISTPLSNRAIKLIKFVEARHQSIVPKILIVDDQVFNIDALKIILQYKLGIPASICDSALSGVDAF